MTTIATNCCELFVSDLEKIKSFIAHDRVYIGSYCCCRKFVATIKQMHGCFEDRMITVVVPNVIQNKMDKIKCILREFNDYDNGTTEFVANDIGGLRILNSIGVEKIAIGPFFSKDKRYPSKIINDPVTPNILSKNSLALLSEFNVQAVELEMFQPNIHLPEEHQGISIHMHIPMMHNTTSNICEIGSLSVSKFKKFNPPAYCHFECRDHIIKYHGNRPLYKIGKEVCCESFYNNGIPTEVERIIERPFFRWLETL